MGFGQRIEALVAKGHLSEAMALLKSETSLPLRLLAIQIQLQAQTGSPDEAQKEAESLLRREPDPETTIVCLDVVGRSLLVHGKSRVEALKALEEARQIAAEKASPLMEARLACSYVDAVLHWIGIEQAAAEIPRMRRLAFRAGDAWSLTSAHLLQAEVRTKRRQFFSAPAELRTARSLLSAHPNIVLEGRLALTNAALLILTSELDEAQKEARRAVQCAERSGSVALRIPSLGTLAHVLMAVGRYDECATRLNQARKLARQGGPTSVGILDSLMQLAMARNDDQQVEALAREAQNLSAKLEGGYSYYGLWHLLTRVKWLLRTNRGPEAVDLALDAIPRIERMADRNLLERMQLLGAEALGQVGRPLDGAALLASAVRANPDPPLDMIAESSRVEGCLARIDDPAAARAHFERAARIYGAIGNQTARADVLRLAGPSPTTIPPLTLAVTSTGAVVHGRGRQPADGERHGARLVESAAAIMELAAHPPLLGIEALALIGDTPATARSALIEEDQTGARRVLASSPRGLSPDAIADGPRTVRIPLGDLGTRTYTLALDCRPSPTARATILALERLVHTSVALARARQQQRELAALWPEQTPEEQLGLVCASAPMLDLIKTTRRIATANVPVLITGETGAGKEVLARALHQASGRRDRIFLPFNCTAVPRDMLDAHLFGYRRGAFTGAHDDFAGIIRSAAGGTLFLDEIGEMPLDVQPKLLRFLESSEVHPLGEPRPLTVDVRIVAATNADLEQLMNEGRFREDLYYRLHVIRLRVPPLRDRREEIALLVESLLEKFAREAQKPPLRMTEEAMEYLVLYHWPGNVRQLANELRRLAALSEPGALVMPEHLAPEIVASRRTLPASTRELAPTELVVRTDQSLVAATEHLERVLITQALDQAGGNVERAAQILGLSRKGLFLKRQRLGML